MKFSRKVELMSGIATAVLALFAVVTVFAPRISEEFMAGELLGLAVFLTAPLLVAVGSYFDGVRNKKFGFVILLLAVLFLTLMLFVHIFGGVFYLYGLWGGWQSCLRQPPHLSH